MRKNSYNSIKETKILFLHVNDEAKMNLKSKWPDEAKSFEPEFPKKISPASLEHVPAELLIVPQGGCTAHIGRADAVRQRAGVAAAIGVGGGHGGAARRDARRGGAAMPVVARALGRPNI